MCAIERRLTRKHGICLRVDRITSDKRNAFCMIAQLPPGPFRTALSNETLIEKAHSALAPLHAIGLRPLVSVRSALSVTLASGDDHHDPFGLQLALRNAGMEYVEF
jgi:hypothetical protein